MRNISFSLTSAQFLSGSKTVTRRLSWARLKAGTRLMGVKKAMGLKKGQKIEQLGALEVLDVRIERLDAITRDEVIAEGFPAHEPREFVQMFCEHMRCKPDALVTRIEFRRVTT